MTFATVATALSQGHNISKVIKSILRMNTPLANSIKEALKQGYTEDQIGEYLEKGKSQSYSQKNKMLQGMTEEEKARGIAYREPKTQKNIKNIIETGAKALPAVAAGYMAGPAVGAALGQAGSALGGALGRAAPQIFGQNAIPGAAATAASVGQPTTSPAMPQAPQTQIPLQPTQTSQPPLNLPNNQVNEPNIPQPQQLAQPEGIPTNEQPVENLIAKETESLWGKLEKGIKKHKDKDLETFLKMADNLKNYQGMNRQEFDGLYQQFQERKAAGEPLHKIVKDIYDAYKAPMKAEESKVSTSVPTEKIENVPIEKGNLVSSPKGVGEVVASRNGKSIIEVDGKKIQVDDEELEQPPLPEKDLADLYDDLIKGIEGETEEDVSRMVQWAGYNPESNTLNFLPHTGDLYTYDNISEEDAALLTDILSVRKTSGSNFIGAWKKDSKSPIGAALSKLIRKLQSERGGKGNEYSAKHGTIYSAYEPAIQAKKRKKKKK